MASDKIKVAEIDLSLDKKSSNPKFEATSKTTWVPFKTNDGKDRYPNYLIELFNNSALNGAIISSVAEQTYGNGFIVDPSKNKSEETNSYLESSGLQEIGKRISLDLKLHGSYALLLTYSPDWKMIKKIEHVDISQLQCMPLENGKIKKWGICYDWNKYGSNDIKEVLPFSKNEVKLNQLAYDEFINGGDAVDVNDTRERIYIPDTYTPGSSYYWYPDYKGGLNDIETDILSSQYALKSLKNGMVPDFLVVFYGNYTEESFNKEVKKFYKMYVGSSTKKLPVCMWAKDKEHEVKIEPIGGKEEDKKWSVINERTLQHILNAHRITSPLLVGISTPGKLGGSEEITVSYDNFYNTVIKPKQLEVLKSINYILTFNGYEEVSIKPIDNKFTSTKEV